MKFTKIKVYRDVNTTVPFMDLLDKNSPDEAEAKSDHVHVDYLASDCNSVQVILKLLFAKICFLKVVIRSKLLLTESC